MRRSISCDRDGRMILIGQKFIQLAFALDAPNRRDVIELRQIGVSHGRVGDEPAGIRLSWR